VLHRPAIIVEAQPARSNSRQRGSGHLKTLIWLGIFAAFLYVSFEIGPVLFAEYQFQDEITSIARYAPYTRPSIDDVRKDVLAKAQSHDLPVTAEDIKVTPHGYGVEIDVNYSVTVNLTVYQYTFDFHPTATSVSLI